MTPWRSPPLEGRHLTHRELEVLVLLIAGKSPKQIACALGISPTTVSGHITRIAGTLPQNGAKPQVLVATYAVRLLERQQALVDELYATIRRTRPAD